MVYYLPKVHLGPLDYCLVIFSIGLHLQFYDDNARKIIDKEMCLERLESVSKDTV